MGRYTDAQARSAKKYLEKFAEIRIRLLPEEKKEVEEAARSEGKSMSQYIKDRILAKKTDN